jgi:phage baseplate assembly protein W
MMPEFGTKLYNVLFEQKDENFNSIAKNIISEEINYWIPEISIQDIQIINVENPIGDDNYKLRVSINFMVKQTKQLDTVIFELQSTGL